jgi:hypothetical protein
LHAEIIKHTASYTSVEGDIQEMEEDYFKPRSLNINAMQKRRDHPQTRNQDCRENKGAGISLEQ